MWQIFWNIVDFSITVKILSRHMIFFCVIEQEIGIFFVSTEFWSDSGDLFTCVGHTCKHSLAYLVCTYLYHQALLIRISWHVCSRSQVTLLSYFKSFHWHDMKIEQKRNLAIIYSKSRSSYVAFPVHAYNAGSQFND